VNGLLPHAVTMFLHHSIKTSNKTPKPYCIYTRLISMSQNQISAQDFCYQSNSTVIVEEFTPPAGPLNFAPSPSRQVAYIYHANFGEKPLQAVHKPVEFDRDLMGGSEYWSRLVRPQSLEVRSDLADNRDTPLDCLYVLATDYDPTLRYQLAENHQAPLEVLQFLTSDENPYVACRAQKTIDRLQS
jgi:hypothetical protein